MQHVSLDDYRWLVSQQGKRQLAEIAQHPGSLVTQTRRLRKSLGPRQTHLVLEQLELRRRAATKFAAANQMFFTRQSLEQATDQEIARVKAQRFGRNDRVADLCCGIGGDLLALAQHTNAVGVDIDPVLTLLAEANCRETRVTLDRLHTDDALNFDLTRVDAWHIDPDRRPQGRRTSTLDFSHPSTDQLLQLLKVCSHAGIKLAPAAALPWELTAIAERRWYGSRRECRQQMAWLGDLARYPGCHAATVVDPVLGNHQSLVGPAKQPITTSLQVKRYVHEPHAAVIAADLTGTLADHEGFQCLTPGIPYLTSDRAVHHLLFSSFEVLEVLPFDRRRLRQLFQQRKIGGLEVKKRGVPLDPAQVQKQLRSEGPETASLLVFPGKAGVVAILARRVGMNRSFTAGRSGQ